MIILRYDIAIRCVDINICCAKMAEKRKRSQNYVAEEKDKLVKILSSHKETILNKKTDGSTNEAKNRAWTQVTNSFNASAMVYRSKDSLMKIWEKMKSESKLYYQNSRRSTTGTGGGPSEIKIDPVLEQVCALLGRGCTGIVGVQDCDSLITVTVEEENLLPKKARYNEGSDDEAAIKFIIEPVELEKLSEANNVINVDQIQTQPDVTPTPPENHISKTPLWSRRRPQYSQTNERTEAISSMCDSYSSVNKKKEDIEELKKQLLLDEIDFKKKMYELQLEAARKEVEIKTEILNQIKGGSMNMQHLFGIPKNNS